MAIKIYGRLSSANVQKINWFCEYANINVINLNYGGVYGKTQTTEFKDMNPNSRVPVLDDNKNSEIIKGDLNLEKLVGKVFKYDFYDAPSSRKSHRENIVNILFFLLDNSSD